MPAIQKTTNYSKFAKVEGNREVKQSRAKAMAKKMAKQNLMPYLPAVVKRENGKLRILDGQSRVAASEMLGFPVYYVLTDDGVDVDIIADINSGAKNWTPKDYINYFAENGNEHYIALRQFITDTEIPCQTAVALLSGNVVNTGARQAQKFKQGLFEIKETRLAYRVGNIISALRAMGCNTATHRYYTCALAKLVRTSVFDDQRFLAKAKRQIAKLVRCADTDCVIRVIDEIYNHGSRIDDLVSLSIEIKKSRVG